jgi:hypothetical protein
MKRSFLLLLATATFLAAGFAVYADKSLNATGMPSVNGLHSGSHSLDGMVTVYSDGIPLDRKNIKG